MCAPKTRYLWVNIPYSEIDCIYHLHMSNESILTIVITLYIRTNERRKHIRVGLCLLFALLLCFVCSWHVSCHHYNHHHHNQHTTNHVESGVRWLIEIDFKITFLFCSVWHYSLRSRIILDSHTCILLANLHNKWLISRNKQFRSFFVQYIHPNTHITFSSIQSTVCGCGCCLCFFFFLLFLFFLARNDEALSYKSPTHSRQQTIKITTAPKIVSLWIRVFFLSLFLLLLLLLYSVLASLRSFAVCLFVVVQLFCCYSCCCFNCAAHEKWQPIWRLGGYPKFCWWCVSEQANALYHGIITNNNTNYYYSCPYTILLCRYLVFTAIIWLLCDFIIQNE